jgi:hypothetical protein
MHLTVLTACIMHAILHYRCCNHYCAPELLKSPLLPLSIEVEPAFRREALASITNPQSQSFKQIVKALFDQVSLIKRLCTVIWVFESNCDAVSGF